MTYTKYGHLKTEELVTVVLTAKDPSDLELELVQRIELMQEEIEDLENEVDAQAFCIDDLKLQLGVLG